MRITLKQLAVFDSIARHGSVSRGAKDVALSQSAASMALRELESGLRMPLFHRSGKQLKLNENGRRLQPTVRSLLSLAAEIEAHAAGEEISGQLRIGASTTIGGFLLGPVCAEFARRFPLARVKLQVMVSLEVMRRVETMSIDVGLIESPCNRPNFEVEELGGEDLVVVGAPHHPLAGRKGLAIADLLTASWCLGETDSYTRQMLTLGLGRGGLSIVLETNALTAIKAAVMGGMGLGCLSRAVIAAELDSGTLVELAVDGLHLHRNFSLIRPKGVHRGALELGFVEMLRESLADRPLRGERLAG